MARLRSYGLNGESNLLLNPFAWICSLTYATSGSEMRTALKPAVAILMFVLQYQYKTAVL